MMNFNELREYIINNIENDTELQFRAKNKAGINTSLAVWLFEKPETLTPSDNRFILIKWHEINGGQTVRHFAVEIWIHAKELRDVVITKDALVNMLDFYNRPCEINRYKKFILSNEGGIYFDENKGLYVDKLFFDCKLI